MTNAPRVACCDDPFLADRGFDAANHDWMVPYPKAFVIPNGSSPGGKPLGLRGRPAQPGRGEPAGPVAARQRRRAAAHDQGLRVRRPDPGQGLVRRLSRPVHARLRVHGPVRRARTSRTASPSCTHRRARGATASCGAPTRSRSRPRPRSPRRPSRSPRRPPSRAGSAAAARRTGTRSPSAASGRPGRSSTCCATASTGRSPRPRSRARRPGRCPPAPSCSRTPRPTPPP